MSNHNTGLWAENFAAIVLTLKGYRVLALMLIAVFVLPLLTVGVWRLATRKATATA